MIDINKKYTTTDGGEVTLYTTNGRNRAYPIVGEVVFKDGGCVVQRWDKDGKCFTSAIDLVEVPIWEPSPELVAVLRPGWIAWRYGECILYSDKPQWIAATGKWQINGDAELYSLDAINQDMLPPANEQTKNQAFRIGNPE